MKDQGDQKRPIESLEGPSRLLGAIEEYPVIQGTLGRCPDCPPNDDPRLATGRPVGCRSCDRVRQQR